MIVRKLQHSDVLAAHSLVVESWSKEVSKFYNRKVVLKVLRRMSPDHLSKASGNNVRVVAVDGGDVVGYGSVHLKARAAKIGSLYVSPRLMGRGIGSRMLKALEAAASKRGLKLIKVNSSVSTATVGFYRKHGFRIVEEKAIGMGPGIRLKIVKMEKAI